MFSHSFKCNIATKCNGRILITQTHICKSLTKWSHSRAHPHGLHVSFLQFTCSLQGKQWPLVTHSGTLENSAAQKMNNKKQGFVLLLINVTERGFWYEFKPQFKRNDEVAASGSCQQSTPKDWRTERNWNWNYHYLHSDQAVSVNKRKG